MLDTGEVSVLQQLVGVLLLGHSERRLLEVMVRD